MTACDKYQRPLQVTYDPCDVNTTILQPGTKLYKNSWQNGSCSASENIFILLFYVCVCHTVMILRTLDIVV